MDGMEISLDSDKIGTIFAIFGGRFTGGRSFGSLNVTIPGNRQT
jgi:hypothetical protein